MTNCNASVIVHSNSSISVTILNCTHLYTNIFFSQWLIPSPPIILASSLEWPCISRYKRDQANSGTFFALGTGSSFAALILSVYEADTSPPPDGLQMCGICLRSSIRLHGNFNFTCHGLHSILCCTAHKDLQILFTAQCIRRSNITCQSSCSIIRHEWAIIFIAGLGKVPVWGLQDLSRVSLRNVMHFKRTDK
jgi:hypothetical protein